MSMRTNLYTDRLTSRLRRKMSTVGGWPKWWPFAAVGIIIVGLAILWFAGIIPPYIGG